MKDETDDVWESIPGAAPLREIYGYWPSLHDANVREINTDFVSRALVIVVDYSDSAVDQNGEEVNNGADIETRITLRWHGVTDSNLRLYDNTLYGMKFVREKNLIETRFDDYTFGLDGFIRSAGVEVVDIGPTHDLSGFLVNGSDFNQIQLTIR